MGGLAGGLIGPPDGASMPRDRKSVVWGKSAEVWSSDLKAFNVSVERLKDPPIRRGTDGATSRGTDWPTRRRIDAERSEERRVGQECRGVVFRSQGVQCVG